MVQGLERQLGGLLKLKRGDIVGVGNMNPVSEYYICIEEMTLGKAYIR
jgi:hypothetical protein